MSACVKLSRYVKVLGFDCTPWVIILVGIACLCVMLVARQEGSLELNGQSADWGGQRKLLKRSGAKNTPQARTVFNKFRPPSPGSVEPLSVEPVAPVEPAEPYKTEQQLWQDLQRERRTRIEETCNNYQIPVNASALDAAPLTSVTRHMLVERRHRVLYCRIPKVASSSWSFALAALQSQMSADELRKDRSSHHYLLHNAAHLAMYGVKPLPTLPKQSQLIVLKNYPKFLFVRHPFQRLVSAYKDKFKSPYPTEKLFVDINRYIIKNFRKNPSVHEIRHGPNATFVEYLHYVVINRYNTHWALATDLCNPCHVDYDYVGKLETFSRDVNHTLSLLMHASTEGFFKLINPTTHQKSDSYHFTYPAYFANVPRGLVEKLYQLYRIEFEMFDYSLDL